LGQKKNEKSGIVRPSGFLIHYLLGQNIGRKYQFLGKLFKKCALENADFAHFGWFRGKITENVPTFTADISDAGQCFSIP
jgi:hypothetical protein